MPCRAALSSRSSRRARGFSPALLATAAALVLAATLAGPGSVRAGSLDDDSHWWDGFGPAGLDNLVMSLTLYDGDVVAAGYFASGGGEAASRVARWTGMSWEPFGGGIQGVGAYSAVVYRGDLVVAGLFHEAGGTPVRNIARWDGASWHPLGAGLDDLVWCLAVHEDELIAGGVFTEAGGAQALRIARWNGSDWGPLGSGMIAEPGFVVGVFSLGAYEGRLVAGGAFGEAGGVAARNIARWDGAAWEPFGSGTNGLVYAVGHWQGDLVIGGGFSRAGDEASPRIALWDGWMWHPIGSGMSGGDHAVASLAEYDGRLIAGGVFLLAGGVEASRVAAWDGASWSALGSGTDGCVRSLAVHDGNLYLGGDFTRAGAGPSGHIARWSSLPVSDIADGSEPCPPGSFCGSGGGRTAILRLDTPAPNPSWNEAVLSFSLTSAARVRLVVHDALGRARAVVADGRFGPGVHQRVWSGRDASGRPLPTGIYFARLEAGGAAHTVKLERLR